MGLHGVDHGVNPFDRGCGQNTVSEVEDVTERTRRIEDVVGAASDLFWRRIQGDRVEVSLDGHGSKHAACMGQVDPPVEAEGVAARLGEKREEGGTVACEVQTGAPLTRESAFCAAGKAKRW